MAGTLYRVDYVGQTAGAAVVYIGDDGVTGMDAGGGIFSGGIAVSGGRARGTVVVTYASGGHLVTGQTISPGGIVTIDFDERANYDDGNPVNFSIGGTPLTVTFTKISDIPIPAGLTSSNPAISRKIP